ncbi:Zinc finger, RING-type [Sesbania bispinosa]|nr:Zinc finger, RING-type [Sesbania bispinosa]
MAERGTYGGRSMSINDLEKLPCYNYVAKDNTNSPVDCAVCLENLTTGDKCRLLPMCKHSFHAQCVDKWLLKTPICPICRSSAGSHSGNQVVGNNDYFIESRESQTVTGSQPDDNSLQLRESIASGPSRNGVEMRENSTLGSPNSGHREVESGEHQIGAMQLEIR